MSVWASAAVPAAPAAGARASRHCGGDPAGSGHAPARGAAPRAGPGLGSGRGSLWPLAAAAAAAARPRGVVHRRRTAQQAGTGTDAGAGAGASGRRPGTARAWLEELEEFRYATGIGAQGTSRQHKVLHLLRHAESLDEAAGSAFPEGDARREGAYQDWQYFDAPLSPEGLAQCALLREGSGVPQAEVVLASPLTRSLQTATEVFGCGRQGSAPPLLVLESLREFNSTVFHPCDSRRPTRELEAAFPHADFSVLGFAADMLLGPKLVESAELCDERIMWLLAWLRSRPERSFACVSHQALLRRLLREHLVPAGCAPEDGRRFASLEVRPVSIVFD